MKDKVVVVTGSSRGIGAAYARLAHSHGAIVVLHGHHRSDALEILAKELDAMTIVCDVADKDDVFRSIDTVIEQHGKIDCLVNCAGTIQSKEFLQLEDQDWYDDFNVNFLGTVHFCQAVIDHMGPGSTIVNVSSIRGKTNLARAGALPYCVSKAGVQSLTVGLAKDLSPNIRVNCVCPGPTLTDMAETWTQERRAQYKKESLIGKIASPEEIAETIYFFSSEGSSVVTGQIFTADGGFELYGK